MLEFWALWGLVVAAAVPTVDLSESVNLIKQTTQIWNQYELLLYSDIEYIRSFLLILNYETVQKWESLLFLCDKCKFIIITIYAGNAILDTLYTNSEISDIGNQNDPITESIDNTVFLIIRNYIGHQNSSAQNEPELPSGLKVLF